MNKKIIIPLVVVIVLVLLYVLYAKNTNKSNKMTSERKKRSPNKSKAGAKKSLSKKSGRKSNNKQKEAPAAIEFDDSSSDDIDIRRIYNTVHLDMCNGMTDEEFIQETGLDELDYISINQLYIDKAEEGDDPKLITADDYRRALDL